MKDQSQILTPPHDAMGLLEPSSTGSATLYLALGLAILILLAAWFIWRNKSRESKPVLRVLTARERAEASFQELLSQAETLAKQEAVAQLSLAIKLSLALKYQVNAQALTYRECLAASASWPQDSQAEAQILLETLRSCERLHYSEKGQDPKEILGLLATSYQAHQRLWQEAHHA